MADSKWTALTENTTVLGTDLLCVVDDPGGSPTSQKATVANVVAAATPKTHAHDAADTTYTPTTAADWDSDADPGDVDNALDQLAERVDDLEGIATTDLRTRTVNITLGGGTAEIADGVVKGDLMFDFAGTLQAWTLLADTSGAVKIDIWKDVYANFPPTNDDSICNGHEPEIAASGANAQDTDLSDWSDTSIAAGDIWRLNVDSCTTITTVTLALKVLV